MSGRIRAETFGFAPEDSLFRAGDPLRIMKVWNKSYICDIFHEI